MLIKALDKTLLDWPEKISLILYTGGCNMKCPYCQNSQLVKGHEKMPDIPEETVFSKLKEKKWFDGVIISGGEPTLQHDLPEFLGKIKSLNYPVKIQTNGTNPEMLNSMLEKKLLDSIAMDVKWSLEKYNSLGDKIEKSIDLIKKSEIDYEFCTTVVPGLVNEKDIADICRLIKGAKRYYLQQFQSNVPLLDKNYENKSLYKIKDLAKFQEISKKYVEDCCTRGVWDFK